MTMNTRYYLSFLAPLIAAIIHQQQLCAASQQEGISAVVRGFVPPTVTDGQLGEIDMFPNNAKLVLSRTYSRLSIYNLTEGTRHDLPKGAIFSGWTPGGDVIAKLSGSYYRLALRDATLTRVPVDFERIESIRPKKSVTTFHGHPGRGKKIVDETGKVILEASKPIYDARKAPTGGAVLIDFGTEVVVSYTSDEQTVRLPTSAPEHPRTMIDSWRWLGDGKALVGRVSLTPRERHVEVVTETELYHYDLMKRSLEKIELPEKLRKSIVDVIAVAGDLLLVNAYRYYPTEERTGLFLLELKR